MNPDKQIKALAELDGFLEIGEKPFGKHELRWMGLHKNAGCPSEWWDLPPYLTSYDAIIPLVEKTVVKQSIKVAFLNALRKALSNEIEGPISDYAMMVARPEQLSEALLRAHNLWEE